MVLTRAALTGASGMLGRHIAADLDRAGVRCMGTSRTKPKDLPKSASWTPLDLTACTPEALDDAWSDAEALILCGALIALPAQTDDLSAFMDVNATSALKLGAWAAKRGVALVYVSSASVYADPDAPSIPETAPLAHDGGFGGFYSLSKLMGEQALRFLARTQNLRLTILRPSSLYGAGLAENKLLCSWLQKAARDETIRVAPPARARVNFVHAADMARAVRLSLSAGGGGWNVGGFSASFEEAARACVDVVGKGRVRVEEAKKDAATDPGTRFDLDGRSAFERLGYAPSVALRQGLSLLFKNELLP